MEQKLKERAEALLSEIHNHSNTLKMLAENVEQVKSQMNQCIGKHAEVNELLNSIKNELGENNE